MPDLHDTHAEHHEGLVAPSSEHAAPTAQMPNGAPGQPWPSPAPAAPPLTASPLVIGRVEPVRNASADHTALSAPVEHTAPVDHVEPVRDVEHTATAPEAVEPSVETVEPVEPKRRGPGRPRIPCFKKLHVSFDEPAYRSLLVVAQVLKAYGRQGTMSQALRFAVDIASRTLAPSTNLLRADDMTARTARLLREAAESSR